MREGREGEKWEGGYMMSIKLHIVHSLIGGVRLVVARGWEGVWLGGVVGRGGWEGWGWERVGLGEGGVGRGKTQANLWPSFQQDAHVKPYKKVWLLCVCHKSVVTLLCRAESGREQKQ